MSGDRLDRNRFFYRTIFLDTIFDRRSRQGNHWVSGNHTGIKVINTNNKNFQLKYCPNPYVSDSGATPLKKGVPKNFKTPVIDGVFENAVAQPGVWVEIEFTVEDEILGGGDEVTLSGAVAIDQGSLHASTKLTIPAAGTVVEILPADSDRISANFQFKSGGSIFVGTPTELADPDYQNICDEWYPGTIIEDYRNKGSLSAKSPSGDVIYHRKIFKP